MLLDLHSLIIPMDCMNIQFIATVLCVAMYVITYSSADQQNSSSFLTSYAKHQNICDKIGWEPKCRKGRKEGYILLNVLNRELFSFKLE